MVRQGAPLVNNQGRPAMTPLTDGSTMGSAVKGNPESTVRRIAAQQPTDRLAELRQMHRSRRRNVPAGTRIQRQIGPCGAAPRWKAGIPTPKAII